MAQAIATDTQQKDNLCGPFCVARILNVDQDSVAVEAGTRLPHPSPKPSVPSGAQSFTDYRYDLPRVPDAESGTSAPGLLRAIDSLSHGALKGVPIRGRWTAALVEAIVDGAPAFGARLIANIRTGGLWGSRPSAEQLLAELGGEEVAGPPPDWDVGHYVELAMLVSGNRGSLVAVRDTYPSLGLGGFHLQPTRAIARALLRGDGREGGVIAVVSPRQVAAIEAFAREAGLEVGVWDNGSGS
jgi:hypothetical protein